MPTTHVTFKVFDQQHTKQFENKTMLQILRELDEIWKTSVVLEAYVTLNDAAPGDANYQRYNEYFV